MWLQWNLDVTNGYNYPATRGYIFAVWAGVRKVYAFDHIYMYFAQYKY